MYDPPPITTELAGRVNVLPPVLSCLTINTPVSPVVKFETDNVLFPPRVTDAFAPLVNDHEIVPPSVNVCWLIVTFPVTPNLDPSNVRADSPWNGVEPLPVIVTT